ncbi:uncharacterized protein LY79DRAFT_262448 [Colletotrichum navitas]|uniref:Uncharacterized protein n=1 Tax=Colletotrichum navitas TaxID=681940 RepID=A0AAD8PVV3_9PEZI|nr:uncharacterized protein LY79DRAFT_262448 [Colletotrichum navitas]KAK1585649.1 hypothetical protein LY79DRAFT_262448 [Colletotrichum navitas]
MSIHLSCFDRDSLARSWWTVCLPTRLWSVPSIHHHHYHQVTPPSLALRHPRSHKRNMINPAWRRPVGQHLIHLVKLSLSRVTRASSTMYLVGNRPWYPRKCPQPRVAAPSATNACCETIIASTTSAI